MSKVRGAPLPVFSTSCVFVPSGSATAGIVTRAPSATASTLGEFTPATSALSVRPWRPSPRTSTTCPGIATSGDTAVAVASSRTLTFTGRERPWPVWTTTVIWAFAPAGTTALSEVSLASVTWALSAPKKTAFDAASFAKLRPVIVTVSPAPTVSGDTAASSGGVLRNTRYQPSAPTRASAARPPAIGTIGTCGIEKPRPRGFDLPFGLPATGRAAGRAAGRSDGNSARSASRSRSTWIEGSSLW
jgi:hypothetical protein